MINRRDLLAQLGAATFVSSAAISAINQVPAVIYAIGAKFDKSFNEGAYDGAERFKAKFGTAYLEYQPQAPAEFERAVAALTRRGANQIAIIGFYYAPLLTDLAPQYPDVAFTLVDAIADRPNVESIVYREQEGAFLAGMLAAMSSKTGKLGFLGAIDIPLIRKFSTGYLAGARHVRSDIEVRIGFLGVTPAAFNDPTAGIESATAQADLGCDVIFAGAGLSNIGIFQTAKERGILAIGVDSNQNGLFPGTILTSQLKRVDVAVYESFLARRESDWRPGLRSLGLKENGVGIVFDRFNAPLVSAEMQRRVELAAVDIIAGRIIVPEKP